MATPTLWSSLPALTSFLASPRISSLRIRFCCDGDSSSSVLSSGSLARFLDVLHSVDARGGDDEVSGVCDHVGDAVEVFEDGASPVSASAPEITAIEFAASCMSSIMSSGLPHSSPSSSR